MSPDETIKFQKMSLGGKRVSEGSKMWEKLRGAQRGQEAFLLSNETYDRNKREFSAPYYAYYQNQRPVPWYLRGHRFRLTGLERTGDIQDEERFQNRVI
jgi:hypothetical protein